MNGTATDWSSEFKFSPFYKTHYSTRGLSEEYQGEVVPSYFDKRRRTLHYAYFPEAWMHCKEKADKAIGEEKKENLEEVLTEIECINIDYKYVERSLIDKLKADIRDTEAWLQCYFELPSPPTWAEEGIAYRILREKKLTSDRLSLDGAESIEKERNVKWYNGESDPIEQQLLRYKDEDYTDANAVAKVHQKLLGIFITNDKTEDAIERYWTKSCLVFPIREIYLGDKGYGGIWGFLTIFEPINPIDPIDVVNILTSISSNLTAASNDYLNSGLWKVERKLWDSGDNVIEHFLETIPYIQDWENIWVTKDNKTTHWWGHEQEENSFMTDWKQKGCKKHDTGAGVFEWELRNIEMFLNEMERGSCKDILDSKICCEYPEISFLPKGKDKNLFESKLREQQLKVFEIVINKWRRRRAMLHIAASAIMGRNMSHNIGSHVIARYAAVAGDPKEQQEEELERGVEDHRTVFLHYLQRRMDFIAEVSTADKPNWSQPLGLVEVLQALNYEKEKARINTDTTEFGPILLSYITGKKGIKASVEIAQNTKEYFNCPSGEVGAHALYIILENIIRNSARHNEKLPDKVVKLKVTVADSCYDGLLKLIITDCQSSVCKIGHINNIISQEPFLNEDGSPNPKYWGIREMQICAQHLRGLPLSDLESPQPSRVLEAIEGKDDKNSPCLAYQLYLQRTKLCAIVADKIYNNNTLRKEEKELEAIGIKLYKEMPDNIALRDYSFLVLPEKEKPNIKRPIRTLSLYCDIEQPLKKAAKSSDPKTLLESLHKVLWRSYRDKRKGWKDKDIKAFVGWANLENKEDNQEPDKLFRHLSAANLKSGLEESDNNGEDPLLAAFGSTVNRPQQNCENIREKLKKNKKLGIVWIDHADPTDFENITSDDPIIFRGIVDSSSPHKSILEATRKGLIGNELIAAALGRVYVLDERVQDAEVEKYRSIPYKDLLPCMGIWVPSAQDCDLKNPNFCKIRQFLKKQSPRPAEFLVLHLTILESLTKQSSFKSDQETLDKLIKGIEAVKGCEVIIVTGRGVPSGSMSTLQVRYLPISALLEYLISRPSKLSLMRALWSANATLH